jgi:hypothetical protein
MMGTACNYSANARPFKPDARDVVRRDAIHP